VSRYIHISEEYYGLEKILLLYTKKAIYNKSGQVVRLTQTRAKLHVNVECLAETMCPVTQENADDIVVKAINMPCG
jgi:hypothetical protein